MGYKTSFVLIYLCLNIMSNNALKLQVESTIGDEAVTINSSTGYNTIPGLKGSFKYYSKPMLWDEAKETCFKDGASVYYPESKEEFDDVVAFLREKDKSLPESLILGIEITATGIKTLDGSPASSVYTNWLKGEPSNSSGSHSESLDCVYVYLDTRVYGLFSTYFCKSLKLPFVCESKIEQHPQCQIPTRLHYTYTEQLGKCYKFHLTPKTWSEARDVCRAEHSDLAVINSKEEAQYLVSLTRTVQRTRIPGLFVHGAILLGNHNNNVEDWQTIEETSLYDSGYACWGNSQPDGGGVREKCGAMFYNGHLTDVNCDDRAFFICEHNIPGYAYEPPTAIKSLECYDDIHLR